MLSYIPWQDMGLSDMRNMNGVDRRIIKPNSPACCIRRCQGAAQRQAETPFY